MQELKPTAVWSKLNIPQFVVLKVQNTSISTEAKLQVYMGMDEPSNNTFGFYLTPGSSFDSLVGKNSVYVRSDSGATGGFAYSDITNNLVPTTFETEHITASISNSFTKYIQRSHTVVVQNISDKDITFAISEELSLRDGFVIKPYQFIGMNISVNSNILLYGENAKASIFVTPSFDANGGINSEMMNVFERYFGIIDIINADYVPKATHKQDLQSLQTALKKEIQDGLALKLDSKTFDEFLKSNTESMNGVVPLTKPTKFGAGLTGSETFADLEFRVNLKSNDPAISLDATNGILINKVESVTDGTSNDSHVVSLLGLKRYLTTLDSKYVSNDGGSLGGYMGSNIIAGETIAGTLTTNNPDTISKSGFYVSRYSVRGVEDYGSIFHIEDHINTEMATQIAVSAINAKLSVRIKKIGTWSEWSELLPTGEFDTSAFMPKSGGAFSGKVSSDSNFDINNTRTVSTNDYSLNVAVPNKSTQFTEMFGMKVVGNAGVGIGISGCDKGVSIDSNKSNSVGLDINTSGLCGLRVATSTTGLILSSKANSGDVSAIQITSASGTNTIGLSMSTSSEDIGISISGDGIGIKNTSETHLGCGVVISTSESHIKNNKTSLIIGGSDSSIPHANILLTDSINKSVVTNQDAGIILDQNLIYADVSQVGYNVMNVVSTASNSAIFKLDVNSEYSAVISGTVSGFANKIIDVTHKSETTPISINTDAEFVIMSNAGAKYGGKVVADEIRDTPIIGVGADGEIDLDDIDYDKSTSFITFRYSADGEHENTPETGEGYGLSISGGSYNGAQIVMVNGHMYYRTKGEDFVQSWDKNELTQNMFDKIRYTDNGAYTVQINSTADIVTSQTVRCRNVISVENVTGFYSDARLKTDLKVLENNLDKVMQINPVRYTPNNIALEAGVSSGEKLGFIAQNVQKAVPEAVSIAPINEILGTDDYLTVDNNTLIPIMLGAIKELKNEIEELKSKLNKKGDAQ